LVAQGYERIGCVTGPAGVHTADDRLAGYRDALRSAQ
jgi:LacI family transcriptional regulator